MSLSLYERAKRARAERNKRHYAKKAALKQAAAYREAAEREAKRKAEFEKFKADIAAEQRQKALEAAALAKRRQEDFDAALAQTPCLMGGCKATATPNHQNKPLCPKHYDLLYGPNSAMGKHAVDIDLSADLADPAVRAKFEALAPPAPSAPTDPFAPSWRRTDLARQLGEIPSYDPPPRSLASVLLDPSVGTAGSYSEAAGYKPPSPSDQGGSQYTAEAGHKTIVTQAERADRRASLMERVKNFTHDQLDKFQHSRQWTADTGEQND